MKTYSKKQHATWWLGGLVAVFFLIAVTVIAVNKSGSSTKVASNSSAASIEVVDKRISDLNIAEDTSAVTENEDEQDQAITEEETVETVDTDSEASQILMEVADEDFGA